MKFEKILLTGGSGNLGSHIIKSGYFRDLLAPTSNELNITNSNSIKDFFNNNEIDAIIHCAAIARVKECLKNPVKAIQTNIIGTANLVNEVIEYEKKFNKNVRFIQISTDFVYQADKGDYSETDPTIPYDIYGWTKLGAECSINILTNYCIIRTSFFNPEKIIFNDAPIDSYSSKMKIMDLVSAIHFLLNHSFTGIVNVGQNRKSLFEIYKEFNTDIKPSSIEKIFKESGIILPKDCSLNCNLFNKLKVEKNYER